MKRGPSLEHAVMAACVVAVAASLAGPVADNSLLVHITTGIGIIDTWSIPRSDPYSFSAVGEPWIVQSWLASAVYGVAEQVGGNHLLIALHALLGAVAATAMVVTARSGSMLRTLGAVIVPVFLAALTWTQRPSLFGLVAFSLLVLIVHKRMSPWLLLPVMWVWVNTHGSFPIGIAWLAAVVIGSWIDERSLDKSALRYLAIGLAGMLVGAINPLGPKLLVFSGRLLGDKTESFDAIIEWQSPNFHSLAGVLGLLAIVAILTAGFAGRVKWRYALGVVGLVAASLYSGRYMTALPIAAIPFLAALVATIPTKSDEPAPAPDQHERLSALVACILVAVVAVGVGARASADPGIELKGYPIEAVDWMESQGMIGPGSRVAASDLTGCYLIWRYQGDVGVFIDDRVDMYPAEVAADYRHLVKLDQPYGPILDRYRVENVLWERDRALATALRVDPAWEVAWESEDWVVLARR